MERPKGHMCNPMSKVITNVADFILASSLAVSSVESPFNSILRLVPTPRTLGLNSPYSVSRCSSHVVTAWDLNDGALRQLLGCGRLTSPLETGSERTWGEENQAEDGSCSDKQNQG